MAVSRARKLSHMSQVDFDDLVGEACVGLLKSVDRFDVNRGVRFSTYAIHSINQMIRAVAFRDFSLVKVSSSKQIKNLFYNLRKERAFVEQKLGISSDFFGPMLPVVRAEVARRFNVTEDQIVLMEVRLLGDISTNFPVGDEDGSEWGGFLSNKSDEPEFEHDVISDLLNPALQTLTERERVVISFRNMTDDRPVPLEKLAQSFGVSKQRVSQIEQTALKKLRTYLEGKGYNAEFFFQN